MGAIRGLVVLAALLSCACAAITFSETQWSNFLNTVPAAQPVAPTAISKLVQGPNNLLYFLACTSAGCGLFSYADGATNVTTIKIFYPAALVSSNSELPFCCLTSLTINGKNELWFSAKSFTASGNATGLEPWRSDGSENGTDIAANLDNSASDSLNLVSLQKDDPTYMPLTGTLVAIVGKSNLFTIDVVSKAVSTVQTSNFSLSSSWIQVGTVMYWLQSNDVKSIYKYDGTVVTKVVNNINGTLFKLITVSNIQTAFIALALNPPVTRAYRVTPFGIVTMYSPNVYRTPGSPVYDSTTAGTFWFACRVPDTATTFSLCKADVQAGTAATVVFPNYPHKGLFGITTNQLFGLGFGANSTSAPSTMTQWDFTTGAFTTVGPSGTILQNFFNAPNLFAVGTNYMIAFISSYNSKNNTFWRIDAATAGPTLTPLYTSTWTTNSFKTSFVINNNKLYFVAEGSLYWMPTAAASQNVTEIKFSTQKTLPVVTTGSSNLPFSAVLNGKRFVPSKDASGNVKFFQVNTDGSGLTVVANSPSLTSAGAAGLFWCTVYTKTAGFVLFIAPDTTVQTNRAVYSFDGTSFVNLKAGTATSTLQKCSYVPEQDKTYFMFSSGITTELWVTDGKTAAGTTILANLPAGYQIDNNVQPTNFKGSLYVSLDKAGISSLFRYSNGAFISVNSNGFSANNFLFTQGSDYVYFLDGSTLVCHDGTNSSAKAVTGATPAIGTVTPLAVLGNSVLFQESGRFLRVKDCVVNYTEAFTNMKSKSPADGRAVPFFVYNQVDGNGVETVYMIGETDGSGSPNKTPVLTLDDFSTTLYRSDPNADFRKFVILGKSLFYLGDSKSLSSKKEFFRAAFPANLKRAIPALSAPSRAASTLTGLPTGAVVADIVPGQGNTAIMVDTANGLLAGGALVAVAPSNPTLTPAKTATLPALYAGAGTQNGAYPTTFTFTRNVADSWEVPFLKINGITNGATFTTAAAVDDGTNKFYGYPATGAATVSVTFSPNTNWAATPGLINGFSYSSSSDSTAAATSSTATAITYNQYMLNTPPTFGPATLTELAQGTKTTFTLAKVNGEPYFYFKIITGGTVTADNNAVAQGDIVSATAAFAVTGTTAGTPVVITVSSAIHNDKTVDPLTKIVSNNELTKNLAVIAPSPSPSTSPSTSPSVSPSSSPPPPSPSPTPSPSPAAGSGTGSGTQPLVSIAVSFDRMISA